ncbi:unnamed protein product [Orchesella dallaii]|uniref:Uncharacterized protein n=1 Tax=Orchesella dallaii TaxID=48710 RepID=A0ABP1S919_9HEXA
MKFANMVAVVSQILFAEAGSTSASIYVDAHKHFPKTKGMSSFAREVKEYASKYDELKVRSLEGLNDFLKPVQHCLIHMTNFGGVDLPSLSVPSVQMKTKLAVCAKSIYAISSSLDFRKNITLGKDCYCFNRPPCILCPLFADSKRICTEINFRKFVTKIRPWTCEVVVSLFQKQVIIPNRPDTFSHKIQVQNTVIPFAQDQRGMLRYIDRLLPSFAPINILITEKEDVSACPQNWHFPNNFGVWFQYALRQKQSLTGVGGYQAFRDTYYVVLTTPIDLKARLSTYIFRINTVFALQALPALKNFEIHCVNFGSILKQESDLISKQGYSATTNVFDATSMFEYNQVSFDQTSIAEKFIFESVCRNVYLKWATTSLHSSDKVYSVSIMGEWLQILRRYNYTIFVEDDKVSCKLENYALEFVDFLDVQLRATLIQLENTVYPTAISHPLEIDDANHKLGFIACGSRSMDYLAFRELFWVFDSYVWMCLFIIYLTIAPITICTLEWLSEANKLKTNSQHASRLNVFSSRIFLQPITILLEQGDAFTNKHLNIASIRWIAAALLIVAIVLSNSYKYDNVYNMMLPRKATPLWFFEQLLSANFTVYTRTNFMSLIPKYVGNLFDVKYHSNRVLPSHTITFVDENSELQTANSEVKNILLFEITPLYILYGDLVSPSVKNNSSNRSQHQPVFYKEFFDKLLRNLKLHPYEKKLAKTYRHGFIDWENFKNNKKIHKSGQTFYISKLLNECNNTAVVLPLSVIWQLLPNIQNQGHTKLSVGKEILVERIIGMQLNGWIPDHLITTLSRTHEFGIWQHIRNIFGRNVTTAFDGSRDLSYQTSQISGNILVIFLAFLCGHVVAAVSFIFEMRKWIYGWVLVLKQSVYLGVEGLWGKIKFRYASHQIKQWLPTWSNAKARRRKCRRLSPFTA